VIRAYPDDYQIISEEVSERNIINLQITNRNDCLCN